MKEELKIAIEDIIRNGFIHGVSSYVTSNKIADLIDQDQQETKNKINDASIKLVAIVDEIKSVLNPKPEPKAEEVHL